MATFAIEIAYYALKAFMFTAAGLGLVVGIIMLVRKPYPKTKHELENDDHV